MKLQRYKHLITEIAIREPQTILEIGTWNGKNSAKMINEAKKYNKDIRYFGFDMFDMNNKMKVKEVHTKHNATRGQAEKELINTGAKYELIIGNTNETLKTFKPPVPIDFVFIDGGHSLDTIANDWNAIKEIINPKTVVIFDDYYHNKTDSGCKTLIDSMALGDEYNVWILFPADKIPNTGLEISFVKVMING